MNSSMKRLLLLILVVACMTAPVEIYAKEKLTTDKKTVRACVIGGMTMTGLWQEIAKRFEAKTDYKVVVVSTGPRTRISVPFRNGQADFLVMHSGDITSDLVGDGYGINMQVCARNELVILGPSSDPAGIMGMTDGAQAFRKIRESGSRYLDGYGVGKREVCQKLWKKIDIKPIGNWVIKDESVRNKDMLVYAAKKNAYMVFGRMPVLFKKVKTGGLKIMVEGDPAMQRPYVLMQANPKRFTQTNNKGSKALADFMLSQEIQTFMKTFGKKESGSPWFYPVWPYNS